MIKSMSPLLVAILLLVSLADAHDLCAVIAPRRACSGSCKVPGWNRRCFPKCTGHYVKCGLPVKRSHFWHAKQCSCRTRYAKCRYRCRRKHKYACIWRKQVKWRSQDQSRNQNKGPSRRDRDSNRNRRKRNRRRRRRRRNRRRRQDSYEADFDDDKRSRTKSNRGQSKNEDNNKDKNNLVSSYRWSRRPKWERYRVWVPICKLRKLTVCACVQNPCRCARTDDDTDDAKKEEPKKNSIPSPSPTTGVDGIGLDPQEPSKTPSPSPSPVSRSADGFERTIPSATPSPTEEQRAGTGEVLPTPSQTPVDMGVLPSPVSRVLEW